MTNRIAFAALLALSATALGLAREPAPAMTEYGLVQGTAEPGLSVYKGIPFAAPPVGGLRWRPPQPASRWDGVRQSTKFGPDPYQGDGKGDVSEDCLYLNVWTPAKSADERSNPTLSKCPEAPM
jgi:para-nitrobenzyl esterase